MSDLSVEERVIDIVTELFSDDVEVNRDTLFVDAMDREEIVMELEEEFDIDIPDDAIEKFQTVGQAIDYIEDRVRDETTTFTCGRNNDP